MPIVPPSLDDRSFDDLVAEALARIPAHAPEYTHPAPGDPGRTLIELFAWLTDTLLYRVNLIPERQRLAFLSLLGLPLRAAQPAKGLVSIGYGGPAIPGPSAFTLPRGSRIGGAETFETLAELPFVPVEGRVYGKVAVDLAQRPELAGVVADLKVLYETGSSPVAPYVSEPLFAEGAREVDVAADTVDHAVWVALLASDPTTVAAARAALATSGQRITVGVAPRDEVPDTLDAAFIASLQRARRSSLAWEITTWDGAALGTRRLEVLSDTSSGLARTGLVTLALPADAGIGAPPNDVRQDPFAGVGALPPRIDDPDLSGRLVAWIRLRPAVALTSLPITWLGINAVELDHRRTVSQRILGQSEGNADQVHALPGQQVDLESLVVEVEAEGIGWQAWRLTDALVAAGPDDAVFECDPEAGLLRFGDGVRGAIPARGARVRVKTLRHGGGAAGNLPPGALKTVTAGGPTGVKLAVTQALPTRGGIDAETLGEAERRIPQHLQHRDRAVTADDFDVLARTTPGVRIGRVEVLPGFKPHTRDVGVPGVISVMALPHREDQRAPNPRPDRHLIEQVHAWLDARRLVGTELYVIGCEYRPISIAINVEIRPGYDRDQTLQAIREAVARFLWPLPPGGPFEAAEGWPLGRPVRDREIEVVVARVPGVDEVHGIALFEPDDAGAWRIRRTNPPGAPVEIGLSTWQLPEIIGIEVGTDPRAPTSLTATDPYAGSGGGTDGSTPVAIPVVPEVC